MTLPLDEQRRRAGIALERVPLNRHLGLTLLDPERPSAGVALVVGDAADNGVGGVHASAVSALAEVAAYLAVLPALGDGEHAVSHMSSLQLVGAAAHGSRLEARGTLDRRGKRLAFVSVAVTAGDDLVARHQVTKSVITARF